MFFVKFSKNFDKWFFDSNFLLVTELMSHMQFHGWNESHFLELYNELLVNFLPNYDPQPPPEYLDNETDNSQVIWKIFKFILLTKGLNIIKFFGARESISNLIRVLVWRALANAISLYCISVHSFYLLLYKMGRYEKIYEVLSLIIFQNRFIFTLRGSRPNDSSNFANRKKNFFKQEFAKLSHFLSKINFIPRKNKTFLKLPN